MDVSVITKVLYTLCTELDEINSKDEFISKLSADASNVTLLKQADFWDIPYQNIPIKKKDVSSYTYVFTFDTTQHGSIKPIKYKVMYIDSIHGAFLVFDLQSNHVINEIISLIKTAKLFDSFGNSLFANESASAFLKFSYYAEIDKSLALISPNLVLFEHPWYAWNKILDNIVH